MTEKADDEDVVLSVTDKADDKIKKQTSQLSIILDSYKHLASHYLQWPDSLHLE